MLSISFGRVTKSCNLQSSESNRFSNPIIILHLDFNFGRCSPPNTLLLRFTRIYWFSSAFTIFLGNVGSDKVSQFKFFFSRDEKTSERARLLDYSFFSSAIRQWWG